MLHKMKIFRTGGKMYLRSYAESYLGPSRTSMMDLKPLTVSAKKLHHRCFRKEFSWKFGENSQENMHEVLCNRYYPVDTRCRFNVYKTSTMSYRRLIVVEMASFFYGICYEIFNRESAKHDYKIDFTVQEFDFT